MSDSLKDSLQGIKAGAITEVVDSLVGKLNAIDPSSRNSEVDSILDKYPAFRQLVRDSIRVMEDEMGLPREEAQRRGSAGAFVLVVLAELAEIEAMPTI